MPTSDPRLLLVTVAPAWLVKKIEDAWGDQLRKGGKLVVMDVDREDIQIVDMEGDDFELKVRVEPKGRR